MRSKNGSWHDRAPSLPARGAVRRAWCGLLAVVGVIVAAATMPARAAEVIPPAPPNHFNDFAGVVSAPVAEQLNRQLAQFERDTSTQIVVAVYPKMPSDSSIEDYATRVYQAWHIGQKGRDNGALLLVFTQSHRMRIQTGYGLEATLPDALCNRIMDEEMAPRFRTGDYEGGLAAGVQAMIAATRNEYHGSGRTAREARGNDGSGLGIIPVVVFIVILILVGRFRSRRSVVYGGRRGPIVISPPWWGGPGGWGGGGGGWSGGGGGGSFSGGGGNTGGGGASGSW